MLLPFLIGQIAGSVIAGDCATRLDALAKRVLLPKPSLKFVEPLPSHLVRLRRHWRTYVRLGTATGVMQLTTLFTCGKLEVGYSLAGGTVVTRRVARPALCNL